MVPLGQSRSAPGGHQLVAAKNRNTQRAKKNSADVRLENVLARLRVLGDVSRQTDGTRSLSRRVLAARNQAVDVLQQLRFARARVSTQQNVDVGPNDTNQMTTESSKTTTCLL